MCTVFHNLFFKIKLHRIVSILDCSMPICGEQSYEIEPEHYSLEEIFEG